MRLEQLRRRLSDSFWFLPAVLVMAASAGALGLIQLDEALQRGGAAIAFTGGPGSARELLATIASAMLTMTALVFTITMVVLQLTSSQFSPRVLRNFVRDKGNQATLGVFLATFVYALLTLRAVRGEDGLVDRFIPGVTITVGFALVLLSVATFVWYIHHIAQSIRVVNIIRRIHDEARQAIEHRPGAEAVRPPPRLTGPHRVVPSPAGGVVVSLDVATLVGAAARADVVLVLTRAVGDYVPRGGPLLEVVGGGEVDDAALGRAVALERERTIEQDLSYGFRQLVDIAEKALSPGVNDPTTAVQCLDAVHDLLRQLLDQPLGEERHADDEGKVRLVVPAPSWEDLVHLAVDEVALWGGGSLQVHRRLRSLLEDLAGAAAGDRQRVVLEQLDQLRQRSQALSPLDRTLAEREVPGQGTGPRPDQALARTRRATP